MSIDTIVSLTGAVFTAVAAVAAVVALVYAHQTVEVAKAAREEADAAAKEAAADRRRAASQAAAERNEADYKHMIRQAERVAEIVEKLFWRAPSHSSNSHERTVDPVLDVAEGWMAERNRLGVALVGVADELPKCAEILNAATPQAAFLVAPAARQEVTRWLTELHSELLTYQRGVRADALPKGWMLPSVAVQLEATYRNRTEDLRITSVFSCVARWVKPRTSFKFTDCCWWRPLAVYDDSGTSRGRLEHARNA